MAKAFSETEIEKIRHAVGQAEALTSGEIVPYIVASSGRYELALWKAATIFAVAALAIIMMLHQFYSGWSLAWLYTGWGVGLSTLVAGSLGAILAAFIRPVKRWFAGRYMLARKVHLNALEAFLLEEVFNTKERTGILLFVSLFERRVEVIGDFGIDSKVTDNEWVDVINRVQQGVREGKLVEGIIEALEMCGDLLKRAGVEIRSDDKDELSNLPRFRGERNWKKS